MDNSLSNRGRGGGLSAFYWYQIFALKSAVADVQEMFSSHGSLLTNAMYHHGETLYIIIPFTSNGVSVTFDILILEIKFLFFKNTLKYSNSGKYFAIFINFNKLYLSKQ